MSKKKKKRNVTEIKAPISRAAFIRAMETTVAAAFLADPEQKRRWDNLFYPAPYSPETCP